MVRSVILLFEVCRGRGLSYGRVTFARDAFRREDLVERLNLRILNHMDELPVYGNDPRVRYETVRGPWEEVERGARR